MDIVLLIVHIAVAAALTILVLMQQGKGADMGAAFGSGASATVFGARGSGSFLTRTTAILATVFFITSLTLAYFSGQADTSQSVVGESEAVAPVVMPAEQPAITSDVPVAPAQSGEGDLPPK